LKQLDDSYDAVVIGAGMGGLVSAALLAKAGMSVCVFDMGSRPGGYLMGFERKGFVFDTSTHWLNECSSGGSVRNALDMIAPGAPEMPALRRIRRYKSPSFDYTLTNAPDELKEELIRDFPDDEGGIHRFFAEAKRLGDIWKMLSRRQRTHLTMGLLEKAVFGLKSIRALAFARYAGMDMSTALARFFSANGAGQIYASEQNVLSALMPIGWAYDGDYQRPPNGGAKKIPQWLSSVLRRWGVPLHLNCRVEKIHVESGRAVGVTVARIRNRKRHDVKCKYVVAACDVVSLYETALPPGSIDPGWKKRLDDSDLYASTFAISMGLDVPVEELGLGEEVVYVTADGIAREEHNHTDPYKAGISVVAGSARDASLAPAGKGTLSLQVMADMSWGDYWKTGPGYERGSAYEAFKREYADVLMDRIEAVLVPDLRRHIAFLDIATPITHWRYTNNYQGSIMGARATAKNFKNGVAGYITPIENLLVGGQWAENGGGVPVAVRAGINSALLILRREKPNAFRMFSRVVDGELPASECAGEDLRSLASSP
jgi:prolycopene isomerase